jgi:signal peptidase
LVAAIILGGWFALTVSLGTPTPFFVVSSGSMIPTLKVGDVIAIKNGGSIESLKIGDIIVYKYPISTDRIIVHRVNDVVRDAEGIGIKTKGDNNPSQDSWTVRPQHYLGTVIFNMPYIGYAAIWLSPPLNYGLMVIIVFVILALELRPKHERHAYN